MNPCHERVKGKRRERSDYGLHKRYAPSAMFLGGSMYAVQQLRRGDRGNCNFLALAESRLQALSYLYLSPRGG